MFSAWFTIDLRQECWWLCSYLGGKSGISYFTGSTGTNLCSDTSLNHVIFASQLNDTARRGAILWPWAMPAVCQPPNWSITSLGHRTTAAPAHRTRNSYMGRMKLSETIPSSKSHQMLNMAVFRWLVLHNASILMGLTGTISRWTSLAANRQQKMCEPQQGYRCFHWVCFGSMSHMWEAKLPHLHLWTSENRACGQQDYLGCWELD